MPKKYFYFILKNDKNTGDIKSEFMTLIENKEDIDVVQSFDEMRV